MKALESSTMKPALPRRRRDVQKPGDRAQKEVDLHLADDVRRHPVDGSAQGAQQHARFDRAPMEVLSETWFGFAHVERPDHPRIAELRNAPVRAQALGAPVEARC